MPKKAVIADEAEQLLRQGKANEAKTLLTQAASKDAADIEALHLLARLLMQEKQFAAAKDYLNRVLALEPDRGVCHFELGGLEIERRKYETALSHFERADSLLPDDPFILLHKAMTLENMERLYEAAVTYKRCWVVALRNGEFAPRLPAPLQHVMLGGRKLIMFELERLLGEALAEARRIHGDGDLDRVERLVNVLIGKAPPEKMPPQQRPGGMFFPGLPDKRFFDRELFPWMDALEARTDVIRDEYLALTTDEAVFKPYVDVDTRQKGASHWKGVNRSRSWSSGHLYRYGRLREAVAARCPETLAALEQVPLHRVKDHGPEVMFSVLHGGTRIPPHYGTVNGRVIVHLPLIVPKNCGAIKVAGESHSWTTGRCLAFDDTYAHAAWNNSKETRVVLIFDVWNPYLTEIEITAFSGVIEAFDRINIDALGDQFFRN